MCSISRPMKNMGSMLIIAGIVCVAVGILISWGGGPLGKLPGDIRIVRPWGSFSFPLMSCLILSLVISLLVALIRLLR